MSDIKLSVILQFMLAIIAHSLAGFSGMCHSSTRQGTSLHMTQFYQAFPRVSTASDKCWGEKAGYGANTYLYFVELLELYHVATC